MMKVKELLNDEEKHGKNIQAVQCGRVRMFYPFPNSGKATESPSPDQQAYLEFFSVILARWC